ncbi:MAG TPA: acyltransferase family protein [Saprospiraceae bacterium]|nr:acyltransferase family protein [Saprospiraceae bacterium]HNG90519.1 acyltransferase family protein [Saprospiraceae bacterium]
MEDRPVAAAAAAKLYWPDRLRNLATLMVIIIHVAAPVAHSYPDQQSAWWWYNNFWNGLTRAGVPLFVMLSGYLLLSKDYPLSDFLRRRFSRVVVPALFWMLVYSIYNHIRYGKPATWQEALVGFWTGPVHIHLWFIYLIIGLYLIYPILRPWVRVASERDFLYFFALCAFCTWGVKILWTFFGVGTGIYFELFTNNCGYFVLGYYLGRDGSDWRSARVGGLLVVAGTLITLLGSYAFNVNRGDAPMQVFFYDYLTPNVSMAAIGWFLLAKYAFNARPLLDVEREFSAASFGIYFAHIGVMDWWSQCNYWHSRFQTFVWITSLIGLVTAMTFLGVMFLRTLPGGKRVT